MILVITVGSVRYIFSSLLYYERCYSLSIEKNTIDIDMNYVHGKVHTLNGEFRK